MHSQNSGSIHQNLPDDQDFPKIDITATKACSSKQKNLLIDNEAYAKEILKQTSYYSLIGGYKDIFKNPTTKNNIRMGQGLKILWNCIILTNC